EALEAKIWSTEPLGKGAGSVALASALAEGLGKIDGLSEDLRARLAGLRGVAAHVASGSPADRPSSEEVDALCSLGARPPSCGVCGAHFLWRAAEDMAYLFRISPEGMRSEDARKRAKKILRDAV